MADLLTDLRLEKIRKTVGDFTLTADFTVAQGQRAALVGPSGSGKTTLLRLIAGLVRLEKSKGPAGDSGKIFLGDEDITDLPVEDRGIGLVFQEHALFPSMNVMENVTFGLKVRKVPLTDREAQAMPWLEKTGLQSRVRASVQTLSGGERQRVAFIRAILWKPRLLLLDEPFSALDAGLRTALRADLVELHKLWPVPLVLVTHDESDLAAVATTRLGYQVDPATGVRKFS